MNKYTLFTEAKSLNNLNLLNLQGTFFRATLKNADFFFRFFKIPLHNQI